LSNEYSHNYKFNKIKIFILTVFDVFQVNIYFYNLFRVKRKIGHIMSNLKQSDNILILGIGNLLLGDEGVGVHCIKELEKTNLPEKVQLLDGGTGGFHLPGGFHLH